MPFGASWTEEFACAEMVGMSLAADQLTVGSLLAGIYLACWDRLQRYWREPEQFERLMRTDLGLDRPRWLYLMEYHDNALASRLSQLTPMRPEVVALLKRAPHFCGGAPVGVEAVLLALLDGNLSGLALKVMDTRPDLERLRAAAQQI